MPSTHPRPARPRGRARAHQCARCEALLAQQSVAGSAVWRSGACHALLLHKCVGIACYGSSAITAQLSEQCVRRTASLRPCAG